MSGNGGHSLVEMVLALALLGLFGGLVMGGRLQGHPGLAAVQGELRAGVEQAFLLARAQGRDVRLVLDAGACAGSQPGPSGETVLPLILPRGIHWGLPRNLTTDGIALPPGMKRTLQAHRTGWAHPCITVTPRHTTVGTVWFLTDDQDAVCLRLAETGRITFLRWRHGVRQWRTI